MKITVYCIGSLKESYWKEAIAEYKKRLGAYCVLEILEFPDYPCKEGASAKEMEDVKTREGEKVLAHLKPGEYLIALDSRGKNYDSIALAEHLDKTLVQHGSSVSFVLGGSMGFSKALYERANEFISFGSSTFPHQLCRVMLLEQLYRSFRILRNEPYHK